MLVLHTTASTAATDVEDFVAIEDAGAAAVRVVTTSIYTRCANDKDAGVAAAEVVVGARS